MLRFLVPFILSTSVLAAPKLRIQTPNAKELCQAAAAPVERSKSSPFKKATLQSIQSYKDLWKNFCAEGSVVTMAQIVEATEKLKPVIDKQVSAWAEASNSEYLQKMPNFLPLLDVQEGGSGIFIRMGRFRDLNDFVRDDEDRRFIAAAIDMNIGDSYTDEPWLERYSDDGRCWKFGETNWKKYFGYFTEARSSKNKIYRDLIRGVEDQLMGQLENFGAPRDERDFPEMVCNCADSAKKDFAAMRKLIAGRTEFAAFDRVLEKRLNPAVKAVFEELKCEKASLDAFLQDGEKIAFGFFLTDSSKSVVLVISEKTPYLQYRFANSEKVELEFPANKTQSFNRFTYSRAPAPKLEFTNGTYTYALYDETVSGQRQVGIRLLNNKTGTSTDMKGDVSTVQGSLDAFKNDKRLHKVP